MSTDSTRFAAPRARDNKHIRRAQIAPLLAAGMSLRAISAATGIGASGEAAIRKEHGAAGGTKDAGRIL
jgi:hypothetical protein